MNLLLRRPGIYLIGHWIVTIGLAAALLVPWSAKAPGGETITLLTGQVVHLDAHQNPVPQQGLVESSMFGTGDTYAVPQDALAATPTFYDPRLFDVSYLGANGYGDASRDTIPVIVQFASRDLAVQAVQRGTVEGSIHLTHAFEYEPLASGYVSKHGPFVSADSEPNVVLGQPQTDGTSNDYQFNRGPQGVQVTAVGSGVAPNSLVTFCMDGFAFISSPTHGDAGASATCADGVTGIYLDGVVHESPEMITPSLDAALPLIGADAARAKGLTGKGIKIAVVDTGIDATHPDLAGRVVAAKDFGTDHDVLDHFGHGTHVASIAAGTGAASDGKYGGVAPQAQLINAKALSRFGSGTESSIINAMEWAVDQGARVVNMSLGGGPTDGTDPMSQAVNSLSQKNVLFVIAAGNSGQRGGNSRLVSTPAAADSSLAVGAVDKSRTLAGFSSRGPRLRDMALKPDIVAPGVSITAARANSTDGNRYATFSGTSMATPMVAGSAALVMQLHPDWTAQQVKDALMSSAAPIGTQCTNACPFGSADLWPTLELCPASAGCWGWQLTPGHGPGRPCDSCEGYVSAYDQGAGLVSLKGIVDQVAVAEPGGISFGLLSPGDVQERSISIRNISSQELTIVPGGNLQGPLGAVTSGIEVSDGELSIAPGESVTLGVRLTAPADQGQYSGSLIFFDKETSAPVAHAALAFVVKKGS